MQTSITDIQNYKRCRRRWDYASSSRRNLTRIGMSKPALELGTLVHAALAEWTITHTSEDPSSIKDLEIIFLKIASARVEEIKQQYTKLIGTAPSEEELSPIYESISLGHAMMVNYRDYWKSPIPPSMRFAYPEQDFIINIPGTQHACPSCIGPSCKECSGSGKVYHKLRVIIDGLLENKSNVHFILERKTYDKRPSEDSLKMMDQFIGYTWAGQQLGIQNLYGLAYDGMWKRAKPPKGATIPDLFLRLPIRFTQDEVDEWGEQLAKTVNEMANSPDIYMNRRWEGCYDCSFDKLCLSQSRGEDTELLIKNLFVERPPH